MKLLNEILGTKYPIIQGGMANIATGEFAAACSNAGALGLIGAGGMNVETLRENIRRCKALTDKPFGVNIMLMHPQADEFAKIVVEEGGKGKRQRRGGKSAAAPAAPAPDGALFREKPRHVPSEIQQIRTLPQEWGAPAPAAAPPRRKKSENLLHARPRRIRRQG